MSPQPLSPDTLKQREQALQVWFTGLLPQLQGGTLQGAVLPVSGDASFRRYFRGLTDLGSWILVDAPPDREDSRPFVSVAKALGAGDVAVPQVLAADLERGFMCLSDFGDTLFWSKLDAAKRSSRVKPSAETLYGMAFAELLKIQSCSAAALPPYDDALLLREMRLFTEWFCGGLMELMLTPVEHALLEKTYAFLAGAALAQPQVFVHRDYHSRNLMYRDGYAPGVIDFQDAVRGAATYDLVSLLKDCYIEWPREQVNDWALEYAALACQDGILKTLDPGRWLRDFDLMGAQRHIKVLGIFSRLWLRDGKPGYLRDMPLTMRYLLAVVDEHVELRPFSAWLRERVLPHMEAALARTLAKGPGARQ